MLPKAKYLKNVFALDLGTTKFCLATLREAAGGGGHAIETVSVPADGMRRGMLANIDQARVALRSLIEAAEKQFNADITRVVVGIAGSHLAGRLVSVTGTVAGEIIVPADVRALVETVEGQFSSETRELLHTVPVGYRIDARGTIEDPLGFRGRSLAADFFMIDADKMYLKDVVELCNDCGLQVMRLYSEPFASASVTVPDAYKELGVALADIGGGTTDGIVFKGGRPVSIFTVNVAGKLMTNDLAIGLNISQDEAEKVKIRFGLKPRPDDAIEVRDLRGNAKTVRPQDTAPIFTPRIHELCLLTSQALLPYRGTLGAGLLLTGGGADVKGITEYFHAKMGIAVLRARPVLLKDGVSEEETLRKSVHSTKLATVIGLLNLELCRLGDLEKTRKNTWSSRYLGQFFNWIKELS